MPNSSQNWSKISITFSIDGNGIKQSIPIDEEDEKDEDEDDDDEDDVDKFKLVDLSES